MLTDRLNVTEFGEMDLDLIAQKRKEALEALKDIHRTAKKYQKLMEAYDMLLAALAGENDGEDEEASEVQPGSDDYSGIRGSPAAIASYLAKNGPSSQRAVVTGLIAGGYGIDITTDPKGRIIPPSDRARYRKKMVRQAIRYHADVKAEKRFGRREEDGYLYLLENFSQTSTSER